MTNSFLVWTLVQSTGTALDPWKLVLQAHWVVQGVMILLLLSSIAAWAIIFWKMIFLRTSEKENQKFQEAFWAAGSMDAAIRAAKVHPQAGLTRIFDAGLQEFNQITALQLARVESLDLIESNVSRSLSKAVRVEGEILARFNGLLANIASAAPFIGLFGTVWGIMTAFLDIEAAGSSSLATVAPGIAEALIATAMGLFAAIPAVLFYNYFVSRSKIISTQMSGFSSDFINTAKRSV
jgi:biopolymer transport protein TolQ